MLRYVSGLTVGHLQTGFLAFACYISIYILEIPHTIKIIIMIIEYYYS